MIVIEPLTIFEDFRGQYVELYNAPAYKAAGIDYEFIQDDISISRQHVLRGIHGDRKTAKLVSCLHGAFYLVVVNNIPRVTAVPAMDGVHAVGSQSQPGAGAAGLRQRTSRVDRNRDFPL